MSELQLRVDAVKQEAGANKVKLQVAARFPSSLSLGHRGMTRCLQALVAEWEQVQAEGGPKSLSAGACCFIQPQNLKH